jgi:hypothetical protein
MHLAVRWLAIALALGSPAGAARADAPSVVVSAQTAKPWTRWWWPGSAVDREGLRAQLQAFAAAGIGGVEITPIYGARGAESREVAFLSPRWMELLAFTCAEAKRLGMGVDMATGTGWPFGGPGVTAAQNSSALALIDGRLAGKPTAMKVKRAAPGGAGLVLDPYSTQALAGYLERFTGAFRDLPRGSLRSQFHDSFEYYQAAWTATLPQEFARLNGYDIQSHARELMSASADRDTMRRLRGDYRRTLAKLHLDYVNAWVAWSHAQGFIARNQAHGAPGNLLDLYAAADIPETESYGMTPLRIPGLRAAPEDVNPDPDPPENLIARFASSAAHVNGKPLASSESLTWLRENFRAAPWAAKPQLDRLFAAGINHIFYHGISYSPADAAWPGWYFYAATQLGPANPLWRDYAAMNAYVERVQSVLLAGRPDNDVLLFWPFDDVADGDDDGPPMRQLAVHDNQWLVGSAAGRAARELLAAGYSFDFISDAQIRVLRTEHGELVAPGARYRILVVPATSRMSPATLAKIGALADAGARVLFEAFPGDVPGFGELEARRAAFRKILDDPAWRGRVAREPMPAALAKLGVPSEKLGRLAYTRRARRDGHDYFIANLGCCEHEFRISLARPAGYAVLLDPLDGRSGEVPLSRNDGRAQVYLQLAPGQSTILRTYQKSPALRATAPWSYVDAGEAQVIGGEWQVQFLRGGPSLPAPLRMPVLRSWTQSDAAGLQSFSGTARYRVTFDAPALPADGWLLDLGDVREAASVTLNGRPAGHAWSLPFTLSLPGELLPRGNLLEIEVTNLPANRIRDLDVRQVDWKVMKEINLVDLRYKPFDASAWEVAPSGLLGPVRLVPLRIVKPR